MLRARLTLSKAESHLSSLSQLAPLRPYYWSLSSIMQEGQPEHEQPLISVYVKLPTNAASADKEAANGSDWLWTNLLDFPVHKLLECRFSKKPYKWLRYATGVVLGAEGHLHKGEDTTSDLVDYEARTLLHEIMNLYYHTSALRIFPIDPDFANEAKTSRAAQKRNPGFRRRVLARDGATCVVTNTIVRYCDAAHIVALRKGNEVRNIPLFPHSHGLINKSILKGSLQNDKAMNPTSYGTSTIVEMAYSCLKAPIMP